MQIQRISTESTFDETAEDDFAAEPARATEVPVTAEVDDQEQTTLEDVTEDLFVRQDISVNYSYHFFITE